MKLIKELYMYRSMIGSLVRRDLRGKYAGSFFGFLWTFMNPLMQLVVYTIVFSVIFRNNIDKFYLFLFVALVPWHFFSCVLTEGANCILIQQNLVKKIYFPRMVIPISYVTSHFVTMLLSFLIIFAVLIVSGWGVNMVALLYLPLVFLVEYVLVIGIALVASSLTVYFRDLAYILGVISQLWMYATPLFYPVEYIPADIFKYYNLNPMVSVVTAYRDILYYKQIPHLSTMINASILGIVVFVCGVFIFTKLSKRFAEEL